MLTILSLTLAVFAFSIYCCCVTHPAQAKEQTPSCHQTEHQKDQSHNNQKCDCHKNIAVYYPIDKIFNMDLGQLTFSTPFSRISLGWKIPIQLSSLNLPESPPFLDSTVPLYIQHSVFRI